MTEKELIKILSAIPKNRWVTEEQLTPLDHTELQNLVNTGTLNINEARRESATEPTRYNIYRLSIAGEIRIQKYQEHRLERLKSFAILVMTAAILLLTALSFDWQAFLKSMCDIP